MKAKTTETSCFHKKYTSIIYDNDGGRLVYINPTDTTKRMANVNTRQFNSALSDHVRSELEKHGIITSPSKSFLDTLSGNGKKIDADEFERMKQNYNAIMANSDVAKETAPLLAEIDGLKKEVERLTNIGHTPESEMNELSTRELIERLIASQLKVEKLEFMIEHGLGWKDMENDCT